MSLDREQEIAFRLAGTVGLPSPYPATGSVEIVALVGDDGKPVEVYLRVIHRLSLRLKIARLVELSSVRAVYAAWRPAATAPPVVSHPAPAPSPTDWSVRTAKAVRTHVLRRLRVGKAKGRVVFPLLPAAIVYVPESAPVLMDVEIGMTAAESAEYYPPLTPGVPRCDRPYCDSAPPPYQPYCDSVPPP
jgi:hypothetical protein